MEVQIAKHRLEPPKYRVSSSEHSSQHELLTALTRYSTNLPSNSDSEESEMLTMFT